MTKRQRQKKLKAKSRAPRRAAIFDGMSLQDLMPPAKVLRHGPLPDPRQWSTEIPELLACPMLLDEHKQVLECMEAIAPIQARGTTVAIQIEFAAAMLAWACSTAYESAAAQGGAGDGPARFSSAEDLIVRRARELYGQGRA